MACVLEERQEDASVSESKVTVLGLLVRVPVVVVLRAVRLVVGTLVRIDASCRDPKMDRGSGGRGADAGTRVGISGTRVAISG